MSDNTVPCWGLGESTNILHPAQPLWLNNRRSQWGFHLHTIDQVSFVTLRLCPGVVHFGSGLCALSLYKGFDQLKLVLSPTFTISYISQGWLTLEAKYVVVVLCKSSQSLLFIWAVSRNYEIWMTSNCPNLYHCCNLLKAFLHCHTYLALANSPGIATYWNKIAVS